MPSFSAKDLREALHDLDSLDPKTDFTTVANSEGLQATPVSYTHLTLPTILRV